MLWNKTALFAISLLVASCGTTDLESPQPDSAAAQAASVDAASSASLIAIVNARSDEAKARDQYRNPIETLEFFGIQPAMTVIEVLPGGGWYSEIVAPYLGDGGTLHAVNYADEMWPLFGSFDPEFIAARKQQMFDWPESVAQFGGNNKASLGFSFGRAPAELNDSVDVVLFIRALHNLNRFEESDGMLTAALAETYTLLKSGGVAGVVQHRAPDAADDTWANGQAGYLKTAAVIAMFEKAGFKHDASSDINANPKDQPGVKDIVWRLPPTMGGSKGDAEKEAVVKAIGESDRMTLRFVKP